MGTMSSKEVVMKAWAEFASRDPERARKVFTTDAEWLAPPDNATALTIDATHHLIGRDRIVFELEGGLIKRVREYMDTKRGADWSAMPQPRP